MSFNERLWARIATYSYETGKQYAQVDRTSWGERPGLAPFYGANSIEFTGHLVVGEKPRDDDGSQIVIGFYHPTFHGAIHKGGIVEVFPNLNGDSPVDYIARGRGITTLLVSANCLDANQPIDECEPRPCVEYEWVYGFASPGAHSAYRIFDIDNDDGQPDINEFPGVLAVPGFNGSRALPVPSRPMLMRWIPGHGFFPSFQACGYWLPVGDSGQPPGTQIGYCCQMRQYLFDIYGNEFLDWIADNPDWCQLLWKDQGGVGLPPG